MSHMEDETLYKRFGRMIASMRIDLGLSQEDVSKKLEIPKSTYGNYERGDRKIPLPDIVKMSKFYGFSIDDFIHREKEIQWTHMFEKMWNDEFQGVQLTREEMSEIIEYTKFILSKRNDSK